MRIFAFHLLNDYSGSPKVLMQLVKGWVDHGMEVHVVTCSGRTGFLSDLKHVHYHFYTYRWQANPILRVLFLLMSQVSLLIKMMGEVKKDDVVYINTVLPFGAALLGRLKGCRVIYHIHETSMKPYIFKKIIFGISHWAANDVVYVSAYLAKQEKFDGVRAHILYNAIEDDFLHEARLMMPRFKINKHVLMVCSLKKYKGVHEYIALAKVCDDVSFKLVVNASVFDIQLYFKNTTIPPNLTILPTQTNLHPFYRWADVVLNLSNPDEWIETFGLTIIEAIAYGLPTIVPPVGGITELVEANGNGFRVDSRDTVHLKHCLHMVFGHYERMSRNAQEKSRSFQESSFLANSLAILKMA